MVQILLNILFFLLLPLVIWRYSRKVLPLTILPILIGVILSIVGYSLGTGKVITPSPSLDFVGWVGVIFLVFSAGLESTSRAEHVEMQQQENSQDWILSSCRLLGTAAFALLLPFFIGTIIAYYFLLPLEAWQPKHHDNLLNAAAIGLCFAVSALPVLVGITRELPSKYRILSCFAVRIAVIDDLVLWCGLTSLSLFVQSNDHFASWQWVNSVTVIILIALLCASYYFKKHLLDISHERAWLIAVPVLILSSWSTSVLGLHPFLGSYLAGIILHKAIAQKLFPEKLGFFALICFAPLFFGQRGLSVDGGIFGWSTLTIAFGLLIASVATKLLAVLIMPPTKQLSCRETLALGSLLQCKGLMEIVVATILQDKGLLSTTAYAVLITLAIISTIITKPLFQWVISNPRPRESSEGLLSEKID